MPSYTISKSWSLNLIMSSNFEPLNSLISVRSQMQFIATSCINTNYQTTHVVSTLVKVLSKSNVKKRNTPRYLTTGVNRKKEVSYCIWCKKSYKAWKSILKPFVIIKSLLSCLLDKYCMILTLLGVIVIRQKILSKEYIANSC